MKTERAIDTTVKDIGRVVMLTIYASYTNEIHIRVGGILSAVAEYPDRLTGTSKFLHIGAETFRVDSRDHIQFITDRQFHMKTP